MKRVSFLLQTARLDKEYTLDEISKKTKIPKKFLHAFEEEIPDNFPNEPYCSLMLREYATFLGLKPDDAISIFRRDYANKACSDSKSKSFFSFTPQFTYSAGIVLMVTVFALYLILEYVKFNRPPSLIVSWPESYSKIVEIKGVTDIESTVKVNQDLVVVDQNGNFVKKLELPNIDAKITVVSTSPSGKTTTQEKILK